MAVDIKVEPRIIDGEISSSEPSKKETLKILVDDIKQEPKDEISNPEFDPLSDRFQEPCPDCGLVFESPNLLKLHQDMTHRCTLSIGDAQRTNKQWKCPICLKFYPDGKIFLHVKNCETRVLKGINCKICGEVFVNQPESKYRHVTSLLRYHMISKHR